VGDIPVGKAIIAGRADDAVNVIVGGRAGVHSGGDVAKSRPPFAVYCFDEDSFREIGLAEDVVGVGIETAEFLVAGRGEDAVDAMLGRAYEVGARPDHNVKSIKPCYFPFLGDKVDFIENVEVDVGAVEERPDLWYRVMHVTILSHRSSANQ
jgi:hypothetical protein